MYNPPIFFNEYLLLIQALFSNNNNPQNMSNEIQHMCVCVSGSSVYVFINIYLKKV